ncbi:MAG: hypothetical protein SGPRY_002650 [Prymnesium sp.]
MLARRFGGRRHVTLTEFASGNMFGPVPALHALASLGVREVSLHLVDKEYVEWLKLANEHPRPGSLPHAIDFGAVWKEWRLRVLSADEGELHPHVVWESHVEAVRDLVLAIAEVGQRRLADAKAQLERLEALRAHGSPHADASLQDLLTSLSTPLFPFAHATVDELALSLGSLHGADNSSALGEIASKLQQALVEAGPPVERLVALVHAWACSLGLKLKLTAYSDKESYLAATTPLSSDLVLGYDLDPASTDDFRHLVAQATFPFPPLCASYDSHTRYTLSPGGFIVGGIQMTEVDPGVPRTRPHVHVHGDHHGVKGNAYNFASTPQHATAFDLVQGQMGGINCFRQPLGCVEVGYNWFESLCDLGDHLGSTPQVGTQPEERVGVLRACTRAAKLDAHSVRHDSPPRVFLAHRLSMHSQNTLRAGPREPGGLSVARHSAASWVT